MAAGDAAPHDEAMLVAPNAAALHRYTVAKLPDSFRQQGVALRLVSRHQLLSDASLERALRFPFRTFEELLTTKELGRTFLYSEQVSSTQTVMQACTFEVTEGLLFLARRQTRGRGRGNNTWVSPDGCLMFTFKSSLRTGSRLPFVQYLVALAVVEAVSRLRGALKLRLKWPNDIYSDSAAKVGGVLCQSSSMKGGAFDICIGVGLNLDNEQPTTCINKLLRGLEGAPVGREELLASFCNVFEPWLEELEVRGFAPFLERYLQAWLHSGQTIEVRATSGSTFRARIDGLSPDGFLKAQRTDTRQVFELHPDGNSLDFLQGLIAAKELPEGKS